MEDDHGRSGRAQGLDERPSGRSWLDEAELRVYLRQLVGNDDDARDLAQDAYVRARRALDRGADPLDPRAWLLRLARNLAIDHLRRRRFLRLFVRVDSVPEPGRHDDRTERIAVWSAVDRLPMNEREAVVLRYRWDLTTSEIAQVLGRSDGAVRALLSRAVQRLRAELGASE